MPIDAQLQQVLDAVPPPTIGWATDPVALRAEFETLAGLVGVTVELPDVHDAQVPGEDGRPDVPVRVYRPRAGAVLPLVVLLHGGGFTIGSVETHDHLARRIARDVEAVVVSVDYRLAPEHPFPAAVDDSWTALRWAIAQAQQLGIDPARVAVAGDSAGGNLAAVLAQEARAAGGPSIAFQLLLYPVTDGAREFPSTVENAEAPVLTRQSMEWFSAQYAGAADPAVVADAPARLAPLQASDLSGLPPAFVATAGHDPLRDDGEAYAAALQAAGVSTVVRRFDELVHGFVSYDTVSPACVAALDECLAALRTGLAAHGEPTPA